MIYTLSRHISVSQPGASGFLDLVPDSSAATRIESHIFTICLQRRYGLHLSVARAFIDAKETEGVYKYDRQGDYIANTADHNRRHNTTNGNVRNMVAAIATSSVILGDKDSPENTRCFNEGHVADIVSLGDDYHTLYETKVVTPLKPKSTNGTPMIGSKFAFGSTEQDYRIQILGNKRRGKPSDPRFDPITGLGYVPARRGDYYDALRIKRNAVIAFIVETFGGITPQPLAHIRYLARRAERSGTDDRTAYGTTRISPTGFFEHHVQRIGSGAVTQGAIAINSMTRKLIQKLTNSTM